MSDTRDWDKEMAKIDQVIASTPATVPARATPARPAALPSGGGTSAAAASAPSATGSWLAAWSRLLLALLMAAALPVWPFAKYCGSGLALYLGAVGVGVIAALWAAGAAWRHRRGTAHVVALLVVVWTVTLATIEVLPRIGYAKQVATWACTAP
jgi:hypothetical protein